MQVNNDISVPGALSLSQYETLTFPTTGKGGNIQMQSLMELEKFVRNQPVFTRWQTLMRAWSSSWVVQKIINLPIDDALGSITITAEDGLDEEDEKKVAYWARRNKANVILCQACQLAEVFGGSGVVFYPIDNNLTRPLGAKEEVRLIPADCWQLNRDWADANDAPFIDITNSIYRWLGEDIHPSRVVVFKSSIIAPNFFNNVTNGWGLSRLDTLTEPLNIYNNLMQALFSAINRSVMTYVSLDNLETMLMQDNGFAQLQHKMSSLSRMIDQNGVIPIAKEDKIERNQIDLTGYVSAITEIALPQLCSAGEIPKERFFGEQAKGLNNGGEASERNYNLALQKRRDVWLDSIIAFYEKICLVVIGTIPKQLDINFDAPGSTNVLEDMQVRTQQMVEAWKLYEGGVFDAETFIKHIKAIDPLVDPINPEETDFTEMDDAQNQEQENQRTPEVTNKKSTDADNTGTD